MAEVQLTQGFVAMVDDTDASWVSRRKWHVFKVKGNIYARSGSVFLHRELLNAPDGVLVDHKNRDGLDCRRENLRLTDFVGNSANRCKSEGKSSRFKGVHYNPTKNRWRAGIRRGDRIIYLGSFIHEEHAARAYDKAAVELFGEFALTNQSLGIFQTKQIEVVRTGATATQRYASTIYAIGCTERLFGSLIPGGVVRRRDVQRCIKRGLAESIGITVQCDQDGRHLYPRQYREGFVLTAAGWDLAPKPEREG